MQLRFRRHCYASFILLALSLLFCDSQTVFGIQDSVPVAKPNGLRLGDVREPARPTRTPIEIGSSTAPSKPESMLNIGSAATLASGANEMDATKREDEEIARASALAMKIAAASMSHATPFIWWMAGPTNNFVVDRTVKQIGRAHV